MDSMEERRQHPRHPTFTMVEILATHQDGGEEMLSLMLRDRSTGGIGGVYIGQNSLGPETVYHLQEPGKSPQAMRLAWKKVAAKYVSIVGFELLNG